MKRAFHLFIFLALCSIPFRAKADHITGGEMYYKYLGAQNGQHNYEVTLKLLMRCNSGRMFPNPIIIGVFSKLDNSRIQDIPVPISVQQRINLGTSDPCISNPPNVCYEVAEYIFPVSLPASTSGYLLVASVNFRVNGLANLSQVGSVGATYTAEIPGTAILAEAEKNNSAQFIGNDLVVVCANSPFKYSFSARDDDGDSLEYYFCGAYGSGSFGGAGANAVPPSPPPYAEVNYATFFGPDIPLGGNVQINPDDGMVSGTAPDIGIYVITVCVAEKRGGKIIAVQRKDIQLNITGCTVAAAILKPAYQLCKDIDELSFENQSGSPLIESYNWQLFARNGTPVASSTTPRFSYKFTDTGLYRVELKTNVGLTCPDSTSAEVLYYPGFNANFNYQGFCFGNPTRFFNASTTRYGSIDKYFWDLGEPLNSINYQANANPGITYLIAGEKTAFLRVTNTNGCVDSVFKKLAVSTNPPISLNFRDTLICPPDTLDLVATGNGIFSWANMPGIISGTNNAVLKVAPLVSTPYVVTQNLDNCIGRDTIMVRVTNRVDLEAMNDTTICTGDQIVLRTSGNGTRFQWTPMAGLNATNIAQPGAMPMQTTRYRVQAFVSACSNSREIQVTTVPYPQVRAGQDIAICFSESANLSAITNAKRLRWSPAASLSDAQIKNPVASPLETTSYIIEVYEDAGCPKPSYDTMVVQVEQPIQLSGSSDTSIVVGQPLTMNITGAPKFLWIPAYNLSDHEVGNPVILFSQPNEGFTYKVIGYNEAGCSDSLEFTVKVFASAPTVFVPTAFTPNQDGLNETLKPTLAGMRQLDYFRVFNRYGQLVFETKEQNFGWDGKLKGENQPSGLFVWVVAAIDYEGKAVQAKGSTMLVR